MRAIDADSLINLVMDATILGDGFKQAFTAIVNGEPTIEPERKKGKWIPTNPDGIASYSKAYAECDQCHKVSYFGWHDEFCRHCGVKMEVEHD